MHLAAFPLLVLLLTAAGCAAPAVRHVIRFDVSGISGDGLVGPPDGRVAVDYEFCIPDLPDLRLDVKSIDPSIRFMDGSRGRVGCGPEQVLCVGSTHQPGWQGILLQLSQRSYITRIARCFWE
jgi:hypothetical protein